MSASIDFSRSDFWLSAAFICFNPTLWNVGARAEYHNKTISRLLNGNTLQGLYLFAAVIFTLGLVRDQIYDTAIAAQPTHALLDNFVVRSLGQAIFAVGSVFVLSSMWALGITGTYLGDYFGFLFDEMVTGFPFSVVNAPMYYGSTLCFLGRALWYGKPAGILLSGLVFVVYRIALLFEDPFTADIYTKRAEAQSQVRVTRSTTARRSTKEE